MSLAITKSEPALRKVFIKVGAGRPPHGDYLPHRVEEERTCLLVSANRPDRISNRGIQRKKEGQPNL